MPGPLFIYAPMSKTMPIDRISRASAGESFTRFISEIVHELKSPLPAITLPAELTLQDLKDIKEGKGDIDRLFPELERRLQHIIAQALEFARRIEEVRQMSRAGGVNTKSEPRVNPENDRRPPGFHEPAPRIHKKK